jgi:hypothetical protein
MVVFAAAKGFDPPSSLRSSKAMWTGKLALV